MDNLTIKHQN